MSDRTALSEVRPLKPESRAVTRPVEAGSYVDCALCGERVKFMAKARKLQVICNIYVDGRWDRVEHYHAECYESAGYPYGEAA
ncbi:MAG: hypothetical protein ACKVUT_07685 [Gaiella sp.]